MATRTQRAPPRARGAVAAPSPVATTSRVRAASVKKKVEEKEKPKPKVVPVDVAAKVASPSSCTALLASHFKKQLDLCSESAKAIEATRVVNAANNSLAAAVAQGFKATTAPAAPTVRPLKTAKESKEQWNLASVTAALQIVSTALSTLRELNISSDPGPERVLGVERAALGILGKAIALEMMDFARTFSCESRPHVVRLYDRKHIGDGFPPAQVDDTIANFIFAYKITLLFTAPSLVDPPLELPDDPMHPLILARQVAPAKANPYLHIMHRTVKGSLRASHLGILALATTTRDGKVTPKQVWTAASRVFSTATLTNTPQDILQAINYTKSFVAPLPGDWDASPMLELEISLARQAGSVESIEKAMKALDVSGDDPRHLLAELAKLELSGSPSEADLRGLAELSKSLEDAQADVVARAVRSLERARRAVLQTGGAEAWLLKAIDVAEHSTRITMELSSQHIFVAGAIDTVNKMASRNPTHDSLSNIRRVDSLRRNLDDNNANWKASLATGAYDCAFKLFKHGKYELGAAFAQFSCDTAVRSILLRWDLLAACWQRHGDYKRAARALVSGLQSLPFETLQMIEQGAATGPLDAIFSDPSLSGVSSAVKHLAALAPLENDFKDDLAFINTPAMAAIAEHMFSFWPDLPNDLTLAMSQALLTVYERMPLRRLRVAIRLVELGHDVDVRTKALYGPDAALAPFLMEYNGLLATARAFATYHAAEQSSDMPQKVLQFANAAAAKLRPLVGKRKDDPNRLFTYMERLCNLLGILGHSLAKVDCLRLLRQLQRKDANAYALTSARLGSEYSKLGKSSRAAVVFAQVNCASAEAQLRYSAFLATIGNLDKSANTYLAARDDSVVVDKLVALERAALAHVAVAVHAAGKDNAAGVINHLVMAFRCWTRAADVLARKSANAWAVTENLLDCTFALALAYLNRGSVRDAEYYLLQAKKLAEAVKSSAYSARAATGLAEIQSGLRAYEASLALLEGADKLAIDGVDAIDVSRAKGDVLAQQAEEEEAEELFIHAASAIDVLDAGFQTADAVLPSPRKPTKAEPILPTVLSHVLRQQAWLYHKAGLDEAQELVSRILTMALTPELKAAEQDLIGRMAMQDAFNQFKMDLFMNSLMESTISLPMGITTKPTATKSAILAVLDRADRAFRLSLSLRSQSGRVVDIREAHLSLALIRSFQTALGQGSAAVTLAAANAINSSVAITLRRERHDLAPDDGLTWPDITTSTAPPFPSVDSLPPNCSVITITVTDDLATMFVSRLQRDREPLVFCLPLDRQSRRDGDEAFTFEAATTELREIIEASDNSAQTAKKVSSREGKSAWWADRHALDKRLQELLATIEFCWLGAFKTVFNGAPSASSALDDFKRRIETIFRRVLGCKRKLKLNIECFATLSPRCRSEELEDFVYFVLDLYQFHGVPVALAELDIDQIGIDVKAVLHEYESATKQSALGAGEDVFLVLDKNVQGIPWESIPALRGRPISRVPSVDFLVDRATGDIDASKVFYILNPSGDLLRTQEHFESWLKKKGWEGITGEQPSEEQLIKALSENDLVLYFGHGGAEQYIRSHKIRHLPRCASTMLWGCSSGALREQGDFDRVGTALHYMVGGCPSLTANLWDVTDRDIDRLCETVFNRMGVGPQPTGNESTAAAVNASRDVCKLGYLTGAAPVVYGIPKRLVGNGIFSA